jgi:hypothetical protein
MSETPVRKMHETNDPASAPPRPSTPQQQQQQQPIPSQHQQERRQEEDRQEQRQEPRQEQRQEQRHEQQQTGRLEDEWQAVQYEFVDDPKAAVRKADELVKRAIEELTTRHRSLAKQLEGNGDPQTEDLRLALHRYRELFKSLVAVK